MKWLWLAFFFLTSHFSLLTSPASNVRLYFQQPYSVDLDTNAIITWQISSNILANGGVIPVGLPRRITPYSGDGLATNYFNIGFYAVSNVSTRAAIVINVRDASTNLVDYTNILHSGFNTYVMITNSGDASVTYTAITNALGGVPLFQSATNGLATTNDVNTAAANATNYARDVIGLNLTNYAKNVIGLNLTNYARDTIGLNATNYARDVIGLNLTNFANNKQVGSLVLTNVALGDFIARTNGLGQRVLTMTNDAASSNTIVRIWALGLDDLPDDMAITKYGGTDRSFSIGKNNTHFGEEESITVGNNNINASEDGHIFAENSLLTNGAKVAVGYDVDITNGWSGGVGANIKSRGESNWLFGIDLFSTANNASVFGRGISNGVANSLEFGPSDASKIRLQATGLISINTNHIFTNQAGGEWNFRQASNASTVAKLSDVTNVANARIASSFTNPIFYSHLGLSGGNIDATNSTSASLILTESGSGMQTTIGGQSDRLRVAFTTGSAFESYTNLDAKIFRNLTNAGSIFAGTNITVNSNLYVGGYGTFSNLTAGRVAAVGAQQQLTNSSVTTAALETYGTNITARVLADSGTASSLTSTDTTLAGTTHLSAFTGDKVLYSDSGVSPPALAESTTPIAKLAFINNLSSDAQTQLNGKLANTAGIFTNSLTGKGTLSIQSNANFHSGYFTNGLTNALATASRVAVFGANKELTNSTVSTTTLGYLDATSSVQTQLNLKVEDSGGSASELTSTDTTLAGTTYLNSFTGDFVLYSDSITTPPALAESSTPIAKLAFINNLSSDAQTQLNGKLANTAGIFTNSLTGKGTLSVQSNATFNSIFNTNNFTNGGIFYLTGNMFGAGTNFGNYLYVSNDARIAGTLFATNAQMFTPYLTNATALGTNYVLGSISFQSTNIYTVANGDNVIDPGGSNTVVYITDSAGSPTAAYNLNGITGGRTDRWLTIINNTTNVMTIVRESGVTAAANRILINADTQIVTNGFVYAWYDTVASRWRIQPNSQVGSFSVTNLNSGQFNLNGSQELSLISGAAVSNLVNYGSTIFTNAGVKTTIASNTIATGDITATNKITASLLTASRVAGLTSASELTNLTMTTAQLEHVRTNYGALTTNQLIQGSIQPGSNITITTNANGTLTLAASGGGGGSGGNVTNKFVQTNATTVVNTATETSLTNFGFGSISIPANTLVAGSKVTVPMAGYLSSDGGGLTLTYRLKLGATTVATGIIGGLDSASDDGWSACPTIAVVTAGASGSVVAGGPLVFNAMNGGTPVATDREDFVKTTATTIDTTVANVVNVTVEWSSASTNNIVVCQQLSFDVTHP